jgi:hypothetical protein
MGGLEEWLPPRVEATRARAQKPAYRSRRFYKQYSCSSRARQIGFAHNGQGVPFGPPC